MHDEQAFLAWMQAHHGFDKDTLQTRLSNCRKIELHEGNLDTWYSADRCAALLARLAYSRADVVAGHGVRHRIPIGGDLYTNTATYRRALRLYIAFRDTQRALIDPTPVAVVGGPTDDLTIPAQTSPRARPARTSGTAAWPSWEIPSESALLTLARTTTPYLRFLHPDIVQAIVDDTERHRARWSTALQERGIAPTSYLWEGGACSLPGIRRYAGSAEGARHHKRMDASTPLVDALALDSNDAPKHLWSFILRGRPFQKFGPPGYQVAHLLDHKADSASLKRLNQEITAPDEQPLTTPLHGLFSSAANTAYVPAALIRPTDTAETFRRLIQRRAAALYGAVCNLVPPPWTIRSHAEPDWDLDAFVWAEPVGSRQHLAAFLAYRHERIERLLHERAVCLP